MLGTLPWLASALLLAGESAMGRPISDFELPDLHDQAVRLSDFRDQQFVVVIFLGTKCPLASLYAPRLNELADEYASSGVVVLAIDPNVGDSKADLLRFIEQHNIRFP